MTFISIPMSRRQPIMQRLVSFVSRARAVARSRRQLAGLTDDQLCDIGLSRAEAVQEANRSVWDVEDAWFRARG